MASHKLPIFSQVVLRRNGKVALLKRAPDALFAPNLYCIVGGAVEQYETFRQAIVREAREEVGITIDPEDLKFVHIFYKQTNGLEIVVCLFECTQWNGEVYNKEPNKHTELLWVSDDHLPANMVPAHRSALEHIKKNVKYSEQA